MDNRNRSLIRIRNALVEAQEALSEIIQDFKESEEKVLPHYVSKVYREQLLRGEQLDQRHKELWLEERRLLAARDNSTSYEEYETISIQLNSIWQEMKKVEDELYSPDAP